MCGRRGSAACEALLRQKRERGGVCHLMMLLTRVTPVGVKHGGRPKKRTERMMKQTTTKYQ
jgi:hypothetical protein